MQNTFRLYPGTANCSKKILVGYKEKYTAGDESVEKIKDPSSSNEKIESPSNSSENVE